MGRKNPQKHVVFGQLPPIREIIVGSSYVNSFESRATPTTSSGLVGLLVNAAPSHNCVSSLTNDRGQLVGEDSVVAGKNTSRNTALVDWSRSSVAATLIFIRLGASPSASPGRLWAVHNFRRYGGHNSLLPDRMASLAGCSMTSASPAKIAFLILTDSPDRGLSCLVMASRLE